MGSAVNSRERGCGLGLAGQGESGFEFAIGLLNRGDPRSSDPLPSFIDRLLVPHHAPAALRTGRWRAVSVNSVVGVGRPALRAWLGCLLRLGCLASCCSRKFALAQRANHEASTSLLHLRRNVQPSCIAAAAWSALAILRAVVALGRSLGS